MLLSLLSQLSAHSDLCCFILHRIYVTHKNGEHKPTDDVLVQCLKETLTLSNDRPTYIIMDALDECPNTFGLPSPREVVLDFVKQLVELSLPNLRICITSRPEIDIRTIIEPLTTRRVSLHDETGQTKDIVDYVSSVVRSDMRMGKWREEDQKLVIETLSERADGMCVSCFEAVIFFTDISAGFDGYSANWKLYDTVSRRVCDEHLTNFPILSTKHMSAC